MARLGKNLRINGDRLWDSIHEIARIGPGIAGGSNRQTLTDEDAQARALFQKWCEDAGLTMSVDQMGTMFMHREGSDPSALPVYVGSHLDTQPTGGRYDGVLGVLAGLEIVRTLNDLDIKTKHPIVVTNWTNEEGSRFAPAMMASGVFAGEFTLETAYAKADSEGKLFGDELERQFLKRKKKTLVLSRMAKVCVGLSARFWVWKAMQDQPQCRCAKMQAVASRRLPNWYTK